MKSPRRRRPQRTPNGFPKEIPVLYEDDALVVLNKPPGLLPVPIKGSNTVSALSILSAELRTVREKAFVVHRIDRFSSGILLFAKTRSDRDILVQQFLRHTPVREYLAVVRGQLHSGEGQLVHYFRREGMFQKLSKENDPKAARAALHYSVLRQLTGASLVRVRLITGLQNQIRVQFAAIGHHLVGDRKYNPKEASESRIGRVALHAAHLEFVHPRSGKQVSFDCEAPPDFQSLVRSLSRG